MELEFFEKIIWQRFQRKHGNMPIIETLQGFILNDRYKITQSLSEGAFGKIYAGYDMSQQSNLGIRRPIIVKFTKNHEMNDREFEALRDIIDHTLRVKGTNECFADTYVKGKVFIKDPTIQSQTLKKQKKDSKSAASGPDAEIMAQLESQIWSYIVQE